VLPGISALKVAVLMAEKSVKIEISRSPDSLGLIAQEYESLARRADWVNPYFSPEWLCSWWKRQKQDRAPLIVLAYCGEGQLLGYWPFVERPGLLGSRGLWPFVYDEANYHFPTCCSEAATSLVESLEKLLGSFLFIWTPQIPDSFWQSHMLGLVQRGNRLTITRSHRSSSLIEPVEGQSFGQFWEEKQGPKSHKSFRYDQRALSSRGEVSWETHTRFEDVRSAMPSTCVVEIASAKALENIGLYTIRGKRGFFFELFPELARAGRVRLSFLRVGDHPVAWQVELLGPNRAYLHHIAYDEGWKKVSPGKQLLQHCMKRCWAEGRVLDFLPAPFIYKERYANRSEPVHELHWIKKTIRGRIARRLIRWNMQWRQKMRQRSPGLAAAVAREQVSKTACRNFQ